MIRRREVSERVRVCAFTSGYFAGTFAGIGASILPVFEFDTRTEYPMPLTDTRIRNLKPDVKAYKVADGGG